MKPDIDIESGAEWTDATPALTEPEVGSGVRDRDRRARVSGVERGSTEKQELASQERGFEVFAKLWKKESMQDLGELNFLEHEQGEQGHR